MDTKDLPEEQCHRKREHVPHGIYHPGTSIRRAICPGVVEADVVEIAHPMDNDPFAGIDDEVTF